MSYERVATAAMNARVCFVEELKAVMQWLRSVLYRSVFDPNMNGIPLPSVTVGLEVCSLLVDMLGIMGDLFHGNNKHRRALWRGKCGPKPPLLGGATL